jgi:hypothetical protein
MCFHALHNPESIQPPERHRMLHAHCPTQGLFPHQKVDEKQRVADELTHSMM